MSTAKGYTYTSLNLLKGYTTIILKVEGDRKETDKFFNMVAAYTLHDHKHMISPQYLDNSLIGTFSSIRAVDSLNKINPVYGKIFESKYNVIGYNVPYTSNSLVTAQKFTGETIMFWADLETFKNGAKVLQQIIGCYAREFPTLSFFISFKSAGVVDPRNNRAISIADLISKEYYNSEKEPSRCRYEAHHTACYSEDLLKYKMWMGRVNPAKIREINGKWDVYVTLTDKHLRTIEL